MFLLVVGKGSNSGFGVGIVVGPRAPLRGQLCLVCFICLFLVSPVLFLVHHSFSSQLRFTVYPFPCVILKIFVVVPRAPLMFLFVSSPSCISCLIPCESQHLLSHSSFHCTPLTMCHSHILRRRSSCPFSVSCPFHYTVPAFPCAIPRVLKHLLCHFSFSPCCVPFHNIPRRRSSYPSIVLCSFHLLFLISHSISLQASPRCVPFPSSIHSVSYARDDAARMSVLCYAAAYLKPAMLTVSA